FRRVLFRSAGMEVRRIAAADHEEAESDVPAERQHRRRSDRIRVAVEEHRLLPVAQRTAARAGALDESREGLELRVVARERLDEALPLARLETCGREQHERGALRAEVLAQARLELLEPLRLTAGPQHPQRKLVNLLDERVVDLRDRDQVLQLALELRVALPEHRDLPLDQ